MRIYSYLFVMMGCLGGFPLPAVASPAINPGGMFNYLESGKSAVLKRIYNSGTSTAFVKVVVQEITYDAQGKPTEHPAKTLSDAPLAEQDLLVASPARMIIPAKGMQATRLLFMGPRTQERYYRVRFIPVLPTQRESFNLSQEDQTSYKDKLAAAVTILSGFGTFLFVRPDTVTFDTRIDNGATHYTVHNQGNSVIVLDLFKHCSVSNKADCSAVSQQYVLPGRRYTFNKEMHRTYSFVLKEGAAERAISVSPPSI